MHAYLRDYSAIIEDSWLARLLSNSSYFLAIPLHPVMLIGMQTSFPPIWREKHHHSCPASVFQPVLQTRSPYYSKALATTAILRCLFYCTSTLSSAYKQTKKKQKTKNNKQTKKTYTYPSAACFYLLFFSSTYIFLGSHSESVSVPSFHSWPIHWQSCFNFCRHTACWSQTCDQVEHSRPFLKWSSWFL